jgi:hypothetical protein
MAPKSKRGKAAAAAKADAAKAKKAGPNTITEAVVKVSDRSVTGNNASRPGSNDIKFVNFSLSYFGEVCHRHAVLALLEIASLAQCIVC